MSIRTVVLLVTLAFSATGPSEARGAAHRAVASGDMAREIFLRIAQNHTKLSCTPGWAVQEDLITCIQWGGEAEHSDYTCFEPVSEGDQVPEPLDYRMFCASPSTIGVGNLD